MKMLAAFLPFYIATLCAISCVSAVPIKTQEDTGILEKIEHAIGDPCPSGWTRFNKYCYLVSSSIKTWSQAQAYCRSQEGNLVKINSAEENDFVLNLVNKKAPSLGQFWIGLKWVANGFYWYDNSVPVYTHWAPNEPNGKAREPCGHMWTGHTTRLPYRASGYWNDIECHVRSDYPNGLVCKKIP